MVDEGVAVLHCVQYPHMRFRFLLPPESGLYSPEINTEPGYIFAVSRKFKTAAEQSITWFSLEVRPEAIK